MAQAVKLARKLKSGADREWPEHFAEDPRWMLAQRIVTSRHFTRSSLLSKFLLHIVGESIEGRDSKITEQHIGVRVFERSVGYRTVEDNIVRNYARQLRRRLADYFADEGTSESVYIDIPLGGYVPAFLPAGEKVANQNTKIPPLARVVEFEPFGLPKPEVPREQSRSWHSAALLAGWSIVLVAITWFAATGGARSAPRTLPTEALWSTLFNDKRTTYVVPADAGFNLVEDVSQQSVPLEKYIDGTFQDLPLAGLDDHSAADLRAQQFTSFVDFQTVATMARLPQFHPERVILRFPRDLHIEDLKIANVVILGSEGSNPWAGVAQRGANFRILFQQGMRGAVLINEHPAPGEGATYVSRWNEPAHETFALVQYLPNLENGGHLLLLQGLDVAGTQAAAETLFRPAPIASILKQATRHDGSVRPFEILLRSTSLKSNALGTQVVASRIY